MATFDVNFDHNTQKAGSKSSFLQRNFRSNGPKMSFKLDPVSGQKIGSNFYVTFTKWT